ncbi:MAG: hypothetical protein KDB07_10400, partial [Planctomycetes bacterium]|nr:hypothetical protein [Planctomycetota bacterium]
MSKRLPLARFEGAFVFFLTALCIIIISWLRGSMLGIDGFYHVRMADLYASGAIGEAGANFHWTTHSIWNGAFADKDFLWHIILIPFTWVFGSDAVGLERAALVAAACASGLIALVLNRVLRQREVRYSALWTIVLLVASTTILYRLALPRSYLLSISAALLGWHSIDKKRWKALAALAFVYTLSYTAPHLLFVLAAIWAFIELISLRLEGIRWRTCLNEVWPPFVAIALGITLGVLAHPQSLNLVKLWLIQNAVVPAHAMGMHELAATLSSWGGAAHSGALGVNEIGKEMSAISGRNVIRAEWGGLLLILLPWVYASLRQVRPRKVDAFAWAVTLLFFAMMLSAERFAEYFYPFATLSAAMFVSHVNREGAALRVPFSSWLNAAPKFALGALVIMLIARPLSLIETLKSRNISIADAVLAVDEHVPTGAKIFHSDWGDFTQLFFALPDRDYLVGLDPTFFHVKDPELYALYVEIRQGQGAAPGQF